LPHIKSAWNNISTIAPTSPTIVKKAAKGDNSDESISNNCFQFVSDEIKHSLDYRLNPVTCKASDVLFHKTGYCYAKSHLLVALLRANGIPSGLCYQRLSIGIEGPASAKRGVSQTSMAGFFHCGC
jgi:transglutaminase-like putative cysteine protease